MRSKIVMVVFFILPGLFFLCIIPVERFVCQRSQNICEFQESHIWNISYYTKHKMPLSDITGAYVDLDLEPISVMGIFYRTVLETKSGKRNLSHHSSGPSTPQKNVEKITHYLNSQEEKLEISEGNLRWLLPFLFILVGLFYMVYKSPRLKKRLKELEHQDKMHFHSDLK